MSISSKYSLSTTNRVNLKSYSGASRVHYDYQVDQQVVKSFTEDNVCGQTLLTIVARGSAIITELFRLTELVPGPFKHSTYGSPSLQQDESKKLMIDSLICNFTYLKNADEFEASIESNETLKKVDEDFCDNFIDILTRFYLTFESVYRYAVDLNNFINELEDGTFVGQSIDRLLADTEGLQLLCEAYYLLGYMLLATDNNFEGDLRERLIVSYYRYSSYKSSPNSNVDNTCNLMRDTGFRCKQQQIYRTSKVVQYHRPDGYPENLFSRVNVNISLVNLLISKLQSMDIYNQSIMTFPHPDHRSAALGQQATMLYVILYFCPNILTSQRARMREISDKFFCDNWIISVYMGDLVNLIEAWEPYGAARESLTQLFEVETARSLIKQNSVRFCEQSKQLDEYLGGCWLNYDSVIEHHAKILNTIRESNVMLKWMLIHGQAGPNWHSRLSKSLHSMLVKNQPDRKVLYTFLQNLSELEKQFFNLCEKILSERDNLIKDNKVRANEILEDLVSIFSDARPMRWMQATTNTKLSELLSGLCSKLVSIDFQQQNARDLTIRLIGDIDTARDSYSDGKSLQVLQLFMQVKEHLLNILRILALDSDVKVVLQSVGDFSYAWRLMDDTFTIHIQQMIKDEPKKVYALESIFMKLASSFDAHLLRIQQINSNADLISVSQYYSTKLVLYICDVLQIIPSTILELVSRVISIQTDSVMGDLPAKITLNSLKDYALPEERFQMLELTYKISHYAESLLMMQNTTIGLIRIDSRQLLEDGIRRELVKRMSDSIQNVLQFQDTSLQNFDPFSAAKNLLIKLERLESVMNGYKRSFEYIQDYLFIYGLRIQQEELSRLVKFNTELATHALRAEMFSDDNDPSLIEHHSTYQSVKAPIPVYGPNFLQSSFILRTLNELLRVTEPRATIYDEQMSAWYEQKPERRQIIDLKVFELIASSLSITGLNGLDQMCCTLLMFELQKFDTYLISLVTGRLSQSQRELFEALEAVRSLRNQSGQKATATNSGKQQTVRPISLALTKMAPHSDTIINYLLRIGQLQAIRSCISCVVSAKCRYEARSCFNCLETLNTSLLSTLRQGSKKSSSQQKAGNGSQAHEDSNSLIGASPREISQEQGPQFANETNGDDDCFSGNGEVEGGEISDIVGNLEESQLIFELTNHLEWIGLSDPLNKVYTLALQASNSSQVFEFRDQLVAIDIIFLVLLDQCSKFHFSPSISGFLPKQSRSFYETSNTVDGQPLFYGIFTVLNHYQPSLDVPSKSSIGSPPIQSTGEYSQGLNAANKNPINRLLEIMGLYVKCSLEQPTLGSAIKPSDWTLEVANTILSMIELIRLSGKSAGDLLSNNYLPKFVADTFQFTICHLGSGANKS